MKSSQTAARQEQSGLHRQRYAGQPGPRASDPLLRIDHCADGEVRSPMAADVRMGLTQPQKSLPAKYFYDERGARLFDAICDLPEYYPTRTEGALLESISGGMIRECNPRQLVELGSGASRKTRLLLDALTRSCPEACYVPIDVSGTMLRRSATALRRAYPTLRVHGIVGDYERHLGHLPACDRRLLVFLGSTIGNFAAAEAHGFLQQLAGHLSPGDSFLLGVDLVKPVPVLEAAYNDSQGVTAEFNLNVLAVLNRELGADFDMSRFEHVAFFNTEKAQIEMHLRASEAHEVRIRDIGLTVRFAPNETIRTEISRKFTKATARQMLEPAGFRLHRWYNSPDDYFALALAIRDDSL